MQPKLHILQITAYFHDAAFLLVINTKPSNCIKNAATMKKDSI